MNPRIQARMKRRNRKLERERFLRQMQLRMLDYDFAGLEQGCPVWVTKEPIAGGVHGFAFGWPSKVRYTVTVTRSKDGGS